MAVTSSTIGGVNTWTFSGAVTDAELKTAWAALITNGVYVINRAIYLDNTADLTGCSGGFLVDFGTQVSPAFILHTGRDKTKSTFKNFTFLQRTGLSVGARGNFVNTWNGTALAAPIGFDGVSQSGGGMIYGVPGNPGGGDPRYLNEMSFAGLDGATIYSQEFAEQELQIVISKTSVLKGITFEKCFGFPQIGSSAATGNVNIPVYRSTQNTQNATQYPLRLYPSGSTYSSVCYVDSYVTRNNADITTRLLDTFGASATNRAVVMILNNYTRESWFGASKTSFNAMGSWNAANQVWGGILKKLQFVGGNGAVIRAYDSRSTTAAQKCAFLESGSVDFLDASLSPTTDGTGKISLVHIGALSTGAGPNPAITRYTGQKYTFQKFGYRVSVTDIDMTQGGDNDLSAFTPVIPVAQEGIVRTEAAINAATSITSFQDLLEELHVLSLGLSGSASYAGAFSGNLFSYTGNVLTTSFTTVNVNPSAASKIAYDAATNTLTLKTALITSNDAVETWSNTTGPINLLGGAAIQGVYVTNAGSSTTWRFEDVAVGSSIVIYDASGVTKYFQGNITTAGDYNYYIAPGTTGTYSWAIELYGKQRQSGSFAANTGGLLFYAPIYVEDVGISQTTQATVAAYTAIDNLDKFYDFTAYRRLSEDFIKIGQIATRSGTAVEIGNFNLTVNASASVMEAISGTTITIKSGSLAPGSKYSTIIATPPRLVTAATTEVITANIEDGNGDSSVTIQGGSGNFTLWKLANATPDDDYATGVNLGNVGNVTYRFLSAPGYKIIIRDNTTAYRINCPMDKGIYTRGLFFGDQVQLAQSAEVTQINTKVDILTNNVAAVPAAVLASTVETGATVVESLRLHNSVLGGKVSGGGSATETFRDLADTKDRLVSSVTETGNRTAEVYDLT